MRLFIFLSLGLMAGCANGPAEIERPSPSHVTISTRDLAMNRPNTTTFEALFRMHANGSGRVWFRGHPDGSQLVAWSLTGDRFCIDTDDGLLQTYGCATLTISGDQVTLAHIGSDSVATGVLASR